MPEHQAYVHSGMFLGWIIDHDLYSEEFAEDCEDEIEAFKDRKLTGPQVRRMAVQESKAAEISREIKEEEITRAKPKTVAG